MPATSPRCDDYYRHSNEADNIQLALRPVVRLYGDTPAADFGPIALKACRQWLVDQGGSRKYVNKHVVRIRGAFRWAVGEELISPSVYQALQAVPGLKRGRCDARESTRVMPVPQPYVDAIKPHVSRQVWAMVQLQQHSAARPGELVQLRPIDLDTTGNVWTVQPDEHKTAYLDKDRIIFFGPQCQQVLREFLTRPVDACLFSPREAERERHDKAECHRRPNQKRNTVKSKKRVGECYTVASYRRAIQRACKLADVPSWSPHRLRHGAATTIRKEFGDRGLECAQVMCGHSTASVTELYAETNKALGVEVALKVG